MSTSSSSSTSTATKSGGGCGCLILIIALVFFGGCDSEKKLEDGKVYSCIGLNSDSSEISPNVVYKYSTKNIIVAFAGAYLIVPPVVVAMDQYKCPVRLKPKPNIAPK